MTNKTFKTPETPGDIRFEESGPGRWIKSYFQQVWLILSRPAAFFRSLSPEDGVAPPLAFALVTHWIGSGLAYLWTLLLGSLIHDYTQTFFKLAGDYADMDESGRGARFLEAKEHLLHWIWGVGSVLIDPFLTLVSILFTTFFVFIGAKILVSPTPNDEGIARPVTFDSALRVICYGMTPAILAGLPLLGGIISSFFILYVTVIGARETYRISNLRAVVVALFPKLLFLGIILLGLVTLLIFAVRFFTSAI